MKFVSFSWPEMRCRSSGGKDGWKVWRADVQWSAALAVSAWCSSLPPLPTRRSRTRLQLTVQVPEQ